MKIYVPLLRFSAAVAVAISFVLAGYAAAQDKPRPSPPVLVTSLGQSLDAFQVQLAVRRAGIKFKYDPRAEVDQLDDAKTLFLAVGASLKGFGDAGITIKDELARAGHLLDALSNQLIELTAPRAHRLIIREDSDADGLFAKIAADNKIPLAVIDNVTSLKQPLQELFAGS
jgi:hypothetical protein